MLYYNELNKYGSDEIEPKLSMASLSLTDTCDEAIQRLVECSTDAIEGQARQMLRKGEFESCLLTLGPSESTCFLILHNY